MMASAILSAAAIIPKMIDNSDSGAMLPKRADSGKNVSERADATAKVNQNNMCHLQIYTITLI